MVVLSLFNGMSTGRLALNNLGFNVEKYYSSEIKPHAIQLTQHHFPDTIQLGDINKWRDWNIEWKSISIVLSGSPCKNLSSAGKREGINGKSSQLFFVFIEILEHIKVVNPNVLFFQENVASASKKDIGIMSRALGVYPCNINSSKLTAQLRDRLYWTNIKTKKTIFDLVTDIPQPKDKNITLKDILTDGYTDRDKARAILESESRINTSMEKLYRRYKTTGFGNIVYNTDLFEFKEGNIRPLNKIELCRLQGFKDNYCDILSRNKAASLLGDGWTLPVIEHIFSFINLKNISNVRKV